MSGPIGYDELRADTVRQAAKTMAGAAITAPKSGGQLFMQGGKLFMETVILDDKTILGRLAAWMRARGKERRETIWFREPRRRKRSTQCCSLGSAAGIRLVTIAAPAV